MFRNALGSAVIKIVLLGAFKKDRSPAVIGLRFMRRCASGVTLADFSRCPVPNILAAAGRTSVVVKQSFPATSFRRRLYSCYSIARLISRSTNRLIARVLRGP